MRLQQTLIKNLRIIAKIVIKNEDFSDYVDILAKLGSDNAVRRNCPVAIMLSSVIIEVVMFKVNPVPSDTNQ